MSRENLRRRIDKGDGEVHCRGSFSGSGGNQFQLGCVCGNITCRVNARQIGFHFFIDGYGIAFHFDAPAFQEVQVDNESHIDKNRVNGQFLFLPVRLSKITAPSSLFETWISFIS